MRLIDADVLKLELRKCQIESLIEHSEEKNVFDVINEQPTAFDREKVVEEIKAQFGCKDCEYEDKFPHPVCNGCAELEVIDDICNIVRKGGVEC